MFDMMDKKSEQGNFTLRASYLEVYNERVKNYTDYDIACIADARGRGE